MHGSKVYMQVCPGFYDIRRRIKTPVRKKRYELNKPEQMAAWKNNERWGVLKNGGQKCEVWLRNLPRV